MQPLHPNATGVPYTNARYVLSAFETQACLVTAGPPGDAFELQQSALLVHQDVTLAAYPLAVDKDINSHDQPAITPTVAHGRVVAIATSNELMLADYHAGRA